MRLRLRASLQLALCLLLAAAPPAGSAASCWTTRTYAVAGASVCYPDFLPAGSCLQLGGQLVDDCMAFNLQLQSSDGNVVLYDVRSGSQVATTFVTQTYKKWTYGTSAGTATSGAQFCVYSSGNVAVLDNSSAVIWQGDAALGAGAGARRGCGRG